MPSLCYYVLIFKKADSSPDQIHLRLFNKNFSTVHTNPKGLFSLRKFPINKKDL